METQAFLRRMLPGAVALAILASPPSPALALVAGMLLGRIALPLPHRIAHADRWLLQLSVILLGLGTDPLQMARAASQGLLLSGVLLGSTFALGQWMARRPGIDPEASLLVSAGTAICGGSAIAAVAAARKSDGGAVALALATVFLLNGIALLIFPPLGHLLGLDPATFGTWVGLAVQDISSVTGAATAFAPAALATAVPTKLARTLWIVPMAAVTGRGKNGKGAGIPLFLIGFLAVALLAHALPGLRTFAEPGRELARRGFDLALLLVGLRFDPRTLRQGLPLLRQGALQWLLTAILSLGWLLMRGR